jgi:two-component system LytT family response regulator
VTPTAIRAVIVDDEAPARHWIGTLLRAHPDIVVVRECVDGADAVETLTSTAADLVFLDVQMPHLDGFGVVAAVGAERMPPVIFTSAYSEFAVRAFEAYALDYLLKPFDEARFAAAIDRAREEIGARQEASSEQNDVRIIGLLEHLERAQPNRFPDAIAIKTGGQYLVVRVAEIDWIEADGNYSKLYVQKRPRLLTKTLSTLEKDVLDPDVFVRVHKSAIVNTTKIAAVEPQLHGDLTLVLQDGTRVQCSRRFRKRLDEKMYFTT